MALVKASHKQLNVILASEVRKLRPFFLVPNLDVFQLFNGFLDLDNFQLSDLLVFVLTRFNLSPPLILLSPLTVSILVLTISLAANTYNNIVIFNIDMNNVAILQNPSMNC